LIGSFGRDRTFAIGSGNFRLTPTLLVGEGRDTLSGIEFVDILGGPRSQEINAARWRGATFLEGGRGNDYMLGGFGPDVMIGGFGNDRLSGRGGRDRLSGGPGVDVLFSRDNCRERVAGGTGWDAAHVDALDITRGVEAFF
jgi:Ca2+-binding RTX toxin-like protein